MIRGATDDGDALERIERELIEWAPLGDDVKAALWLYAWSSRQLGRRRDAAQEQQLSALG